MNISFIESFVTSFFNEIEENEIVYCVLRNYESLPNPGNHDIDILIENTSNIFKRVENIIQALNWKLVYRIELENFRSLLCYHANKSGVQSVQIDIWTEEKWRGIKWINSSSVLSSRQRYGSVFIPSKGSEAAITLLKDVMGKSKIKDVYYQKLMQYASIDRDTFVSALEPFDEYAEELYNKCISGDFHFFNKSINKIRRKLIRKNACNLTIYLKESLNRIKFRFISLLYPPGIIIVFVGPDGSGKTTLMEHQKRYLSPLFASIDTYHIRLGLFPELKTGYGFSAMSRKMSKQKKNQHIFQDSSFSKRSLVSFLASWFVLCYYTLEFFFGKFILMRSKQKNHLVLFDRYYYDHFSQPYTRDLIRNLKKLLLLFVTKPDFVFHINTDAEIMFNRKQELNVVEIRVQNEYLKNLFKGSPNVISIDTGKREIEDISSEIFCQVIGKLKDRKKDQQVMDNMKSSITE